MVLTVLVCALSLLAPTEALVSKYEDGRCDLWIYSSEHTPRRILSTSIEDPSGRSEHLFRPVVSPDRTRFARIERVKPGAGRFSMVSVNVYDMSGKTLSRDWLEVPDYPLCLVGWIDNDRIGVVSESASHFALWEPATGQFATVGDTELPTSFRAYTGIVEDPKVAVEFVAEGPDWCRPGFPIPGQAREAVADPSLGWSMWHRNPNEIRAIFGKEEKELIRPRGLPHWVEVRLLRYPRFIATVIVGREPVELPPAVPYMETHIFVGNFQTGQVDFLTEGAYVVVVTDGGGTFLRGLSPGK